MFIICSWQHHLEDNTQPVNSVSMIPLSDARNKMVLAKYTFAWMHSCRLVKHSHCYQIYSLQSMLQHHTLFHTQRETLWNLVKTFGEQNVWYCTSLACECSCEHFPGPGHMCWAYVQAFAWAWAYVLWWSEAKSTKMNKMKLRILEKECAHGVCNVLCFLLNFSCYPILPNIKKEQFLVCTNT